MEIIFLNKGREIFRMLRGINKQIIEIKCPNNECFEKILLFVKAEKTDLSNVYVREKAKSYYDSVMMSYGKLPLFKQRKFRLAIAFCALVGIVLGCLAIMLLV